MRHLIVAIWHNMTFTGDGKVKVSLRHNEAHSHDGVARRQEREEEEEEGEEEETSFVGSQSAKAYGALWVNE